MSYRLGDSIAEEFITSSSTGAAINADSLPTASLARNGTDDGAVALTVANIDTGRYKVTGTIPLTYARGDKAQIALAATIGTVACKAILPLGVLDSKLVGDLADAAGGDTSGTTTLLSRLTAPRAANLDNLDALLSSRSTYAGADTAGTTALLSRLTAVRAGLLDNLDSPVSTRSTYAGADTAGTTALLARLTATRAGYLDNLQAVPALDGSGRVLLQPAQPGVTIPTVTTLTDPPADSTTLTRLATAIELDGSAYRFTAAALALAPTGGGGSGGIALADLQSELDARGLDATHTARLDVATSTRLPTTGYTAPANPADYARDDVAPGWWVAPPDVFATSVETGESFLQWVRKTRAVLYGRADVAPGTVVFRRPDGVTASLTVAHDTLGNRTAVTDGTN